MKLKIADPGQQRPGFRLAAASTLAGALLACTPKPMELSSDYSLQEQDFGSKSGATQCRLRLGMVDDQRSDKRAMGELAGFPIRVTDSAAWLRSALRSLSHDPRMTLVEGASDAGDVTLSAHLLKAYVMNQNSAKSATVVVRVHYEKPASAPRDEIYRGSDEGVNWFSGRDETKSALDTSLTRVLNQVDRDLAEYCSRPIKTS